MNGDFNCCIGSRRKATRSFANDNETDFSKLDVGDTIYEVTMWVYHDERDMFTLDERTIRSVRVGDERECDARFWKVNENNSSYFCTWTDVSRTWFTFGDGDRVPSTYTALVTSKDKIRDAVWGLVTRASHPWYGKPTQAELAAYREGAWEFLKTL